MSKDTEGLGMKYFVLSPLKNDKYGIASRAAIRRYATMIYLTNPALANDLQNWVETIETGLNHE